MSDLFSWFSWGAFLQLSRPDMILILAGSLMPYTLVVALVILFLIHFIFKRFIIKKKLNMKHYLIIITTSVLLLYILLVFLMNFMAIGLGRISQYI